MIISDRPLPWDITQIKKRCQADLNESQIGPLIPEVCRDTIFSEANFFPCCFLGNLDWNGNKDSSLSIGQDQPSLLVAMARFK